MEKNTQFRKNFIWNIVGIGFNAFNSLFFMIAITRINGVENAGIFTIAFSTACILYMIGIYAGRIYQVTENNENITNKDYILNRSISCIAIVFLSIIFVIIRGYDLYKCSIFIILVVYKALEAFSDVFYGIFQKNDFLDKAGKSSFIKAIISIIAFIVVDIFTKNLILASISIVIVYIAVILLYDIVQSRKFISQKETINLKNSLSIFKGRIFSICSIIFRCIYN